MQNRTRLFRKSASLPVIGVFLFAGKESVTTEYKMLPNVLTSRKLSRQETISKGQGDVFHFALFYEGGFCMKYHVFKDSPPGKKRHRDYGKYLYAGFLMFTLIACNVQPVMAATIWDKASEIMKDVYNQIILISTIAAVVTASVALLLMNFSKSGKTVDESRAWLKRIIITWAILNGLGFIMAYITPFFAGGKWNG